MHFLVSNLNLTILRLKICMSLQKCERGCSQTGRTNTTPPPLAQMPLRRKVDRVQESIQGKTCKCFCPAFTCRQRRGTVLGIALAWLNTTVPMEISPPPL